MNWNALPFLALLFILFVWFIWGSSIDRILGSKRMKYDDDVDFVRLFGFAPNSKDWASQEKAQAMLMEADPVRYQELIRVAHKHWYCLNLCDHKGFTEYRGPGDSGFCTECGAEKLPPGLD